MGNIMKKLKICFLIGVNPFFDGGMGLYQKNLLKYVKSKNPNYEITVLYFGGENKEFLKEGVKYIELKSSFPYPINQIIDNFKILSFLKKNNFNIINSHALWGYWMRFYKKKKNQKIIHTYHGVTYNFFKNHLKKFNLFKKILFSPILIFSYFIEKPPMKKADKIICVSEKVKKQIQTLYEERKNIEVVRTGVDLKNFKQRNKMSTRKKLNLDKNKIHGLYVGKGGYWTKGLDKTIKISKELYKLDYNYRLIVIGSDLHKVKHLINEPFIIFLQKIERKKIPLYYNASDVFFCMSRYEGGAPTLVVSEAMASGCLLVCSESSKQEIIEDGKQGLIIKENYMDNAKKIIKILNNQKKFKKIIKNSGNKMKELSLEKWGKKYLKVLIT